MAVHSPNRQKNSRPPRTENSSKLGRTLRELEAALSDWDNLSPSTDTRSAKMEEERQSAKLTEVREKEFRKKTKKLLNQLRQQLAELNK